MVWLLAHSQAMAVKRDRRGQQVEGFHSQQGWPDQTLSGWQQQGLCTRYALWHQ